MTSLGLPSDAATQVYTALGRRGSGKSYGTGVWVEGFLAAGAQVVILDPVGNWWGLQLDANGKDPSRFKIPIIGGLRGNIAMPPGATGAIAIARSLVRHEKSAIIDVSLLRRKSLRMWATDFLDELLEAKKEHPGPLLLVLEEAHKFAPQSEGAGTTELLEAAESLTLVGRNFGIGVFMLSQRPQKIHKDFLSQAEVWLIFQQLGMHERKVIETTLASKQTSKKAVNLGRMLPELQVGEAILFSPQWLRALKKIRLGKKSTYDSTATPVGRPRRIVMPKIEIDPKLIEDIGVPTLPGGGRPQSVEQILAGIQDDQIEPLLKALRSRRRMRLV